MRAMLVIPEEDRNIATKQGLVNKYLFIAELLGYKNGDVAGKISYGRKAYLSRELLNLVYPEQLDDLYENIWLERMYDDIDYVLQISSNWLKVASMAKYRKGLISIDECASRIETFEGKKWSVPVEIDVSNSVTAIIGLLLKHAPFMERCNMTGSKLVDAWHNDVVTDRNQFKAFIMRRAYGSTMDADKMWKDMNIKFTEQDVIQVNKEMETGEFAVSNKLKDFIIKNVKTEEIMNIKLMGQEFKIECNKYYNVGDVTNQFDFFDTHSNSIKRIHNTETIRKPDLNQFRRYFPTLLVHGIDSKIMDNTMEKLMETYDWGLDIHDAVICCCEAVDYTKDVYCSGATEDEPSLDYIFNNGNQILGEFFTSIGMTSSQVNDFKEQVLSHVDKYTKPFTCNRSVMK